MEEKKRILSGIKPSGELTLGSYLGAIKNWVELSSEYECFYMMADMHAITVRQNPAELRRRTLLRSRSILRADLTQRKTQFLYRATYLAHNGAFMGVELLHDVWRAFQNDAV